MHTKNKNSDKLETLINPLLKKMMRPYNYRGMLKIVNKYIEEGNYENYQGEGFYKCEDWKVIKLKDNK